VPDTAQVAPLAALSFVTVAVKDPVSPACTEAVVGATLTEIGVGVPPPSSELVDPPPQPLTNAHQTIADANTNLAARSIRTRAKAVSYLFVSNFSQMKTLPRGSKLSLLDAML